MALRTPSRLWKILALVLTASAQLAAVGTARPVLHTSSVDELAEGSSVRPLLQRVTFAERADGLGYVIRFHLTSPVAAYSEPDTRDEGGLKMILFNTDLHSRYRRGEPEGLVESYSEEASSGHLTFRFKLDPNKPVTASAYRDKASSDLLVGLTYAARMPEQVTDVARALPKPAQHLPVVRTSATGDESNRQTARNDVSAEAKRWMLDTIVIDAGHGGRDPGAGANGVREKDVTLGVALKLGEYIKENMGVNVVYTRDHDRFIALGDRGKIANGAGGKLFVSIHVNSSSARSAVGTETYFLGMHKSDAARKTMERENSVVNLEHDPSRYEGLTEEELIRMSLTHSAYMRKSEELADLIEKQFEERVGRRSRGVKQAGFYVLWGASMPAVLVELGFLTNPREAAFLASESGQAYMASAIFRAVRNYKEEYERGLAQISAE